MSSRPQTKLVLGASLVLVSAAAVSFFMAGGPDKSPPSAGTPAQTNAPSSNKSAAPLAVQTPPVPGQANPDSAATATPAAATTLPEAKPEILESIHEAAISYSAEELPKIQPFLLHSDPEVRAAALQGMITLGDAAAAPLLRNAALLATSPEEATALRQAADYVELPSGSLITPKAR